MNEQDKKRFIDLIQKNMGRKCQNQCKTIKNSQCFDICYNKYLKTLETINQTIKQEAYRKHSIVAYKAYPEPQINMLHYYGDIVFPTFSPYSFARKWDASV